MKIKFIESSRYLKNGSILRTKKMFYPSLTFPLLSAITPDEHDITVQHELLEEITYDEKVDLVGITAITNNVYRAYEIAAEFRKRDVPVVMGGFHVTSEPEEAAAHCDVIFTGEAERTWPEFLEDFKRGRHKKIYSGERDPVPLDQLPVPDLSIMNPRHYFGYRRKGWLSKLLPPVIPVQTARGCPNLCDFCDVIQFHRGTYRPRPIPDVIREIKSRNARMVCFVDDNFFASIPRAKELMVRLIPLGITWITQATLNGAEDPELLALARTSGCRGILVGLETISRQGLDSLNKTNTNKIENYEKNLRAFRRAGIDINASLVFGNDRDTGDIFKDTYRFLIRNRVPYAGLQPLRPTPGTPFYNRLKEQKRLKEEKWWLNRERVADVFDLKYKGTPIDDEFPDNFFKFYKRFYSLGSIFRRFLFPPQKRCLFKIIATLLMRKKISTQSFISEG